MIRGQKPDFKPLCCHIQSLKICLSGSFYFLSVSLNVLFPVFCICLSIKFFPKYLQFWSSKIVHLQKCNKRIFLPNRFDLSLMYTKYKSVKHVFISKLVLVLLKGWILLRFLNYKTEGFTQHKEGKFQVWNNSTLLLIHYHLVIPLSSIEYWYTGVLTKLRLLINLE
jgi:hypothetical protein